MSHPAICEGKHRFEEWEWDVIYIYMTKSTKKQFGYSFTSPQMDIDPTTHP
jgi:hypothetical protein